MKRILIFQILLVLYACSSQNDEDKSRNIRGLDTLELQVILNQARADIKYESDIYGGVLVLESHLGEKPFMLSHFNEYQSLVSGYILLREFEKADSVIKSIDRDSLPLEEEKFFLTIASDLAFQKGSYAEALELLEESYKHPGSKSPLEIENLVLSKGKWLLFSRLHECDSVKKYISVYISDLNSAIEKYKLEGIIDSSQAAILRDYRARDCPLFDSLGFTPPQLVVNY